MLTVRESAPDGRPSITAGQFAVLRQAYDSKFGPTKAARIARVHRNTASMYFKLLRSGAAISLKIYTPKIVKARQTRTAEPDSPKFRYQPPSGRRPKTFYPYIANVREEDRIVMEVNDLVPKGLEPDVRADICQDMLVAILGGLTTPEELKANKQDIRRFIKTVYRKNFEDDGDALSFNLGADYSDDEIASNIAAEEWWAGEFYERGKHETALRLYVPPTQVEETYHSQVRSIQARTAATGTPLSFEEVEELLNGATAWPR